MWVGREGKGVPVMLEFWSTVRPAFFKEPGGICVSHTLIASLTSILRVRGLHSCGILLFPDFQKSRLTTPLEHVKEKGSSLFITP